MSHRQVAPYGTWKSPINADDFAAPGSVVLDQIADNVRWTTWAALSY